MRLPHRLPVFACMRRLLAILLMVAGLLPLAPTTQAATFTIACGDIAAFVAAITTANTNNQPDTIELAASCTYQVSVPNNPTNAFPIIGIDGVEANTLTINGNDATIERVGSENSFRFFQVAGSESDSATLILNDLTLRNGEIAEGSGGAIALEDAALSLNQVTLTNNSATEGGAVSISFSQITVSNSTFSNNSANEGGALNSRYGTLEIEGSTFSANTTTDPEFSGGGAILALSPSGSITNSTFSGNTSASDGGAIRFTNDGGGEMEIINSTISGNSAADSGGGINNGTSAGIDLLVSFSTITGNTADSDSDAEGDGGGITGVISANSSLIAGNFDTPNNAGTGANLPDITTGPSSLGYNLIGNLGASDFAFNTIGDRYGDPRGTATPDPGAFESATPINPALEPLANNGGLTQTHALFTGSPAIDHADATSCPETDQRGITRPIGPACDIGAYEGAVAAPLMEVVDDTNAPIPNGTTTPLVFGTIAAGGTATRSFTIRNIGEVSINVTNFTVTGGFTSDWPADTVIFMPETSLQVQLQFSATVPGSYNGLVTFNTTDPANPQYTFPLTVVVAGQDPAIALFDHTNAPISNGGVTPVEFGSIPVGGSVTRSFTIRNQGEASLFVSNMLLPAGFSLIEPFPVTAIAIGASLTFEVQFNGTEPGISTGTIQFDTNDPDNLHFSFPVTGTVRAAPPATFKTFLPLVINAGRADLTITSMSISPSKQSYVAGEPVVVTVVVKNDGTAPTAPFWVDLYVNPAHAPQINDLWHNICGITPCVGMTWALSDSLAPGESITLTTTVGYDSLRSYWLGWLPSGTTSLYAQVDSWNTTGTTGTVDESNENNNLMELGGLTVTGSNPSFAPWQPAGHASQLSVLPARPVR